jgi:hypothetical protein
VPYEHVRRDAWSRVTYSGLMRRGWVFGVLSAAAALFAPASADAAPPLQLPWSCDDSYPVTNGHQTNTHTGMDAWAWDFGLPAGTEVVAPADGVVRLVKMNSTQGGCNSAYANDANYVVIEFGDGTEALLMHLQHQSSDLSVGQAVKQGDVVGRVGLTGWVCGAHLHFQIQQTCDSWWCQSQPAEFVDLGDPDEGPALTSENCPTAEPCALTLDGSTITIDDANTACFDRITSWFWPGADGWEDAHIYTWANDAPEPDTIGVWQFGVDAPGDYRLEVFVPDADASSQQAAYEVQTGTEIVVLGPVDQGSDKGWVDLGVVAFEAGEEHWVRLSDNTGEDRDLDRKLAFDAIRLTFEPAGAGSDDDGGATSDAGDDDTGGGVPDPGDPSDAGGTSGADDGSSDPDATDDGALPFPAQGDDEGGGCRAGAPRDVGLGFVLLVVPALLRRRRSV